MTLTKNFLRRYSDLPALIHLLTTGSLTFLDPATWDDKNDSLFMRLYRDHRRLKSVLAVCFSQETETYHHWSVFAAGSSGVCISFKKQELLAELKRYEGIRAKKVSYVSLNALDGENCEARDLPFMKRAPFAPEAEFRVIYEDREEELPYLDIDIPLSCIDRISLSPWMPRTISASVKQSLKRIPKASSIEVTRSTLIQNDTWAKFGRAVVGEGSMEDTARSVKKRKK
jgi:hypothetical protein